MDATGPRRPPPTRPRVWWRETVDNGRVTSVLVTEIPAPVEPAPVASLVADLASSYFGGLQRSCGGLVAAAALEEAGAGGQATAGGQQAEAGRQAAEAGRQAAEAGPQVAVVRGTSGVGPSGTECPYDLVALGLGRTALIRLGRPRLKDAARSACLIYPIIGGLLLRPGAGALGSFSFEVSRWGGTLTLAVKVEAFQPRLVAAPASSGDRASRGRLGRLLYGSTESLVHRVLVARFLRRHAVDLLREQHPGRRA